MGIISKNIENLKPDKEYIVTVRAKNSDVNVVSDYTDSVRFRTPTDSTIPNAPAGLLLAASFLNVLFKYDDSIDPDHARYEYELYKQAQIQSVSGLYQIISGETPHRTGFVQTNVFVVSVDDNSYTTSTTSVTNPVKYYGRVRSIDSSGNISDWTNIVQSGDTPLIDEEFIGSLTAAKITAGTIGAHTIVLSGSTSIIQSANFNGTPVGDGSYSSATTGWLINGQGKAYFYDATVVGSIDIGGFDSGSFHVNTSGDMWLGAGTYGAAPFRVSRDGVLEIGAGTGSRIGGQLIDTIAETVIDFNGRNNRNSTNPTPPTLPSPVTVGNLVIGASYIISSPGNTNFISIGAADNNAGTTFIATGPGFGTGTVLGETIDHTLNTDGSANISFEWNYTYSSADDAANNIDGFYVHIYSSDSSSPYVIGTTPNLESTYPVDYLKRSIVFSGLPADKYYTFGVKAFRVVDKDIATPGIKYSSIVQSSVTQENPYRPSANVNYTGNIGGTLASILVSYADAGNTVATNFNANNDRNNTTPTAPTLPSSIAASSIKAGSTYTILTLGNTTNAQWNTTAGTTGITYSVGSTFTAVAVGVGTGTVSGETIDHVLNTDGSVDISFEWIYTASDVYNVANNIDGFIVYVRSSTNASAYSLGAEPSEETTYYLPRDKRAFILPAVAADRYYTFGVRAYRMVDTDINSAGIIYSSIVKSTVTGENPYQPSSTVAFAGNITGTVNGTAVATLVAYANAGNTVATNFNANNDRNSTTPTSPTIASDTTAIDHTINTDGSADITFEWIYTSSDTYNAANNIDGFIVYVRPSTSSSTYTFGTTPAEETTYFVPREKRVLILPAVASNIYYTFGVRAYRMVDTDIASAGIIYSSIVKSSVVLENPYRPQENIAFAGDITGTVNGTAVATLVAYANAGNTVATNFNTNNDNNGLTPTSPVIVSNGTAIDHTINTDGSADISFEWTYTNSDTYNAANNIDGFIVYVRSTDISGATPSSSYVFGSDPSKETTYYLPREKRAFILPGVAANRNYNFAVRAYRMVNSNVATPGIVYSPIIQSTYANELYYQPSTTVAFAGNVTGTVNGTAVTTITTGINNFNNNNDSISTTPATPTSVLFDTATSNTNASIDLPLNWTYTNSSISISSASYQSGFATSTYNTSTPHGFTTGNTVTVAGITPSSWNRTATITVTSSTSFFFSLFNGSTGGAYSSGGSATNEADAYDIDGFVVFLRTSTSTDTSNITTAELNDNIQQIYLTAEKRSHTFSGISPSSFYRAAVRAYRVVYTHVNSAGVIYGPLTNTTERVSATAVLGGSTGIKIGNGTIYIGTDPGAFNDINTGFYVDSTGKFSLKDKLTWNGTDTLSVTGTINATSGTFNNTITVGTHATTKINIVGTSATTTTAIYSSGTGYGTGTGFWMDASGRFSLGNNLTWNGTSTLTITGAINATSGTFNGRLQAGDIYIPNTTSPVFSVTTAGVMTATSGTIAGWTIGANALYVGLNSTSGTSYINTSGGAWFSAGVLSPSFSGFGAPPTTGGATNIYTTTVIVDGVSQTRGYLRNISYGSTKPGSPVLGDIHFS